MQNVPANWTVNEDLQVESFQPRNDAERKVARILRMMLNYWVLRTMVERARQQSEPVSDLMVEKAKQVRVCGFRDEYDSGVKLAPGQPLFDDERLQQAGTRIAYLLPTVKANRAVGDNDRAIEVLREALTIEEQIVTMEVYRALYDIDLLQEPLAA
jgi:hypothetical protein